MNAVLEVREATVRYALARGRTIAAVDGVTLSLGEGEIVGLVGESGCGKSSLGRAILGLVRLASGQVFWKGRRDCIVDLAAGLEVRAQRLFECETDRRTGKAGCFQPIDRRLEQGWRGRKEYRDPVAGIADRLRQLRKAMLVIDVERDVAQPLQEPVRDVLRKEALGEMLFERLQGLVAKARVVQLGSSRADDPQMVWKQAVGIEAVERRKEHAARKVAGCTEQQQRGGFGVHGRVVSR